MQGRRHAVVFTSDIEDDSFGNDGETVLSAADVRSRIRVAHVADDEHTATIILGATGWQRSAFFAPAKQNLATDERLAAAAQSHRRADLGDLDPRVGYSQNYRRGARSLLLRRLNHWRLLDSSSTCCCYYCK